jgi:hypothetical protein
VFHFAAEGGAPIVAARWQQGATPGVTVLHAWVTTAPWGDMDEGLRTGRTFIVFEAETPAAVATFVNPMQLVCSKIEVWPVADYLPQMQAYEAQDPAEFPFGPNVTPEQQAEQIELFRVYMATSSVEEAVQTWRDQPQAAPAVHTARRRAQDGAW